MAKEGIPSFLLDCRTNDNISEIEAEYGVKGFAVVVRLWQKIYAEKGYYCEWIERSPLLFLSNWFGGNSGVTVSLINEIVKRCLNNGIFDAKMHEDYSILTSARIQEQYFSAVKRREEILVQKEYLLVSVDKIKGIAYKNDVSVCRNQKNVCRNDTSKGKVSKGKVREVKGSKENICAEPEPPHAPPVISLILNDKSLHDIFQSDIDAWVELYPAVDIMQELRKMKGWLDSNPTKRKTKRGISRFINSWLARTQDSGGNKKDEKQEKKNSFNNFRQREYDFEELERKLLGRNTGGSGNG